MSDNLSHVSDKLHFTAEGKKCVHAVKSVEFMQITQLS